MIFDTHLHTEFSFDSAEKLEAVLASAKQKNLGVITTEHKDLNYLEAVGFPIDFNVEDYFKAYAPYRSENYLLGIELGLDRGYTAENRRIALGYDFDLVIGSLHTMAGQNLSSRRFFQGMKAGNFYRQYLTYAKEMVEENSYIQSLAHLDYPSRYAPFPELFVEDYPEEFQGLFEALLAADVTLEVNLKRPLEGEVGRSFRSIFTGYQKAGGRFVTLASDAHIAEDIGRNFEDALKLMEEIGLKVCYYKKRERIISER